MTANFSHAWRALRHRNFQLYFVGQGISLLGNWMTNLATSWLVYRLTHSLLLLGVVTFAGQIVAFLLAPFAGVWIERIPRRTLLVITQSAAAAQSLSLAALTLTGRINLHEIIALMAVQGVINAFDMPGRQSFLVQMVGNRDDLPNAIAISSSMVNAARLIGPSIAGLVIAAVGEGWCYLLDGVSYFAVIASLLLMRIAATLTRHHTTTMLEQMREGWTYVSTFRPTRTILLFFGFLALMGYNFPVLLPAFAVEIFHGNARTLGFLTGAAGIGSLTSALSLALRKSVVGLTRMMQISAFLLGAALMLFSLSHTFWISLILMSFVGFGIMQCASAANTIIQSLVSDQMRARVMSFYTMAFFGSAPFGSLFAGSLAHRIGAPHTLFVTGTFCLLGAAVYSFDRPRIESEMRPIYIERGMIPAATAPVT